MNSYYGVLSVGSWHDADGNIGGRLEYLDITEAMTQLWAEHKAAEGKYDVEMVRSRDNKRLVITKAGIVSAWIQ